jgi:transposase-like protein
VPGRKQVIGLLRSGQSRTGAGKRVGEVCRALGISEQSYYRWRSEYGGHAGYASKIGSFGTGASLHGALVCACVRS